MPKFLSLLGASTAALLAAGGAHAQSAESATLEDVVVVGSRTPGRLALESAAPVDVLSGETLRSQGFTDVNRALEFIAPSFSFPRSATAPSAANTRAASLRGLSPDQVLVLVDGKRWHSSAVVNFNNVFGRGSVPTDLGAIPMAAVARIEILRDGAAAQYGSDAIAGVINIVLKSDLAGSVTAQGGQTSEGDGQNATLSVNTGFALGDRGRINLTVEARDRNSTNRAGVDSRFGRVTNEQGDPDSLDLAFVAKGDYALAAGPTAYADIVYDHRTSVSPAQYRAPTIAPALYPRGFIPHIHLGLDDLGGTVGLKGEARGWTWDLSDTAGYSGADFKVDDTANTTLGAASPTRFEAGGARYFQNVAGLALSRGFKLMSGANLAAGLEHRHEQFKIVRGELGSYAGAGAQGFPGFNPAHDVDAGRNAVSAYVDGELKPVASLSLGAAARYEHYSDFGDTVSGKLSLFFKPTGMLALRATASTGFRAPSLQQQFFSTVTSQSSNGQLVNVGTFAVEDPVSRALGSSPLKAEKSRNVSGGLVFTPFAGFALTADVFHIDIDDRIALSETLSGAAVTAILARAGITNASQARFFTNAADTTTEGFELTANWRGALGDGLRYDLTAGYTSTDNGIESLKSNPVLPSLPLLATSSIDLLTTALPHNKTTLVARLEWRRLTVGANLARFGSYRAIQVAAEQTYGPITTLDLTADLALTSRISLGVGVLNATDAYPDKIADRALSQGGGLLYPEVGAVGTNGREYFLRLSARF